MQAKPKFILPLADVSAGLSQLGGKGASLARLAAAGLPYPQLRRLLRKLGLRLAACTPHPDAQAVSNRATGSVGKAIQLFTPYSL